MDNTTKEFKEKKIKSKMLTMAAIQISSKFSVVSSMEERLALSSALSILSIASSVDSSQVNRLIALAKNLAK